MALQIAQDDFLAFVTDAQFDNLRVDRVVFEFVDELVVLDTNLRGVAIPAVNDCRNQALTSQAAARTFPLVGAQFSIQMNHIRHCCTPK